MIGVVDYGAGNVRSVCNALKRLETSFEVCGGAEEISSKSSLILPGVGHFKQLATALETKNLRQPITDFLQSGKPFLGICLGMQILFESSEESPGAQGLRYFTGQISRLSGELRIPHMGWNVAEPINQSFIEKPEYFYFAHTYAVLQAQEAAAITSYGTPFVAAVQKQNVFGVQFHPEKSGRQGLRFLQRFIKVGKC